MNITKGLWIVLMNEMFYSNLYILSDVFRKPDCIHKNYKQINKENTMQCAYHRRK